MYIDTYTTFFHAFLYCSMRESKKCEMKIANHWRETFFAADVGCIKEKKITNRVACVLCQSVKRIDFFTDVDADETFLCPIGCIISVHHIYITAGHVFILYY